MQNMQDKSLTDGKHNNIIDSNGQTFLEFLVLFTLMISLSFLLLRGINSNIATRWQALVKNIVTHHEKSPTIQVEF